MPWKKSSLIIAADPEESIYIGDSIIDQKHANSCSVPFIAFKNPTLVADYHVNGFLEILALPPLATSSN